MTNGKSDTRRYACVGCGVSYSVSYNFDEFIDPDFCPFCSEDRIMEVKSNESTR